MVCSGGACKGHRHNNQRRSTYYTISVNVMHLVECNFHLCSHKYLQHTCRTLHDCTTVRIAGNKSLGERMSDNESRLECMLAYQWMDFL